VIAHARGRREAVRVAAKRCTACGSAAGGASLHDPVRLEQGTRVDVSAAVLSGNGVSLVAGAGWDVSGDCGVDLSCRLGAYTLFSAFRASSAIHRHHMCVERLAVGTHFLEISDLRSSCGS
jgi:hypothetical protein